MQKWHLEEQRLSYRRKSGPHCGSRNSPRCVPLSLISIWKDGAVQWIQKDDSALNKRHRIPFPRFSAHSLRLPNLQWSYGWCENVSSVICEADLNTPCYHEEMIPHCWTDRVRNVSSLVIKRDEEPLLTVKTLTGNNTHLTPACFTVQPFHWDKTTECFISATNGSDSPFTRSSDGFAVPSADRPNLQQNTLRPSEMLQLDASVNSFSVGQGWKMLPLHFDLDFWPFIRAVLCSEAGCATQAGEWNTLRKRGRAVCRAPAGSECT